MLSLQPVIPYVWMKQLQQARAEEMHIFFPLPEVVESDAFCLIRFTYLMNLVCLVSFLTCYSKWIQSYLTLSWQKICVLFTRSGCQFEGCQYFWSSEISEMSHGVMRILFQSLNLSTSLVFTAKSSPFLYAYKSGRAFLVCFLLFLV